MSMPSTVTGPRNIVILGALSAMAEAAARQWAEQPGTRLILVGRTAARLETLAADLRVRGADVETLVADLVTAHAERSLSEITNRVGAVDVVLLAYGTLGDQKRAETDLSDAAQVLAINFTSAAAWCLAAANILERQNHGCLIVIGSVAGDRGRQSNYVYGAAKGGLGILVQGIAHRLARTGARALLIKPGFVDTPMTAHIERKGLLWARPDAIGRLIVELSRPSSKRPAIVYAPGFWRWIMLIIRNVPALVFHRTRL